MHAVVGDSLAQHTEDEKKRKIICHVPMNNDEKCFAQVVRAIMTNNGTHGGSSQCAILELSD